MAAPTLFSRIITQKSFCRNYALPSDKTKLDASVSLWKNLSIYAVPIALALAYANVYLHEEENKRPEFIPYDHLRIRNRPFPWGDGTRSFFHNPQVNALPTGYEDDE